MSGYPLFSKFMKVVRCLFLAMAQCQNLDVGQSTLAKPPRAPRDDDFEAPIYEGGIPVGYYLH